MSEHITIRLGGSRADIESCEVLQRAVWGLTDLEITSTLQLIAILHAGGLLHLAETADGQPMAFVLAIPATRGGVAHLHSDMLGVLPTYQNRGWGTRLKWAQRKDALERGVSLITWTYDPLQARNASLNLRRLGALATEFLPNFYGVTSSALHHGMSTDRLFVRWDLDAERVRGLASQTNEASRTGPLLDLPRINDVKWQAGWPVSTDPNLDLEDPELLLEIPPEWDILCKAAPRVAEGWQVRVGQAFAHYLGKGYVGADFVYAEGTGREIGRRRPFYILRRG
jgi:predicted GNAT superfamily acetyltransferase